MACFEVELLNWLWASSCIYVLQINRANNEQQTRQDTYQARRTRRKSIVCQRETQIEKRESLRGDKSGEGESDKEERQCCCKMGGTHFLTVSIPSEHHEDTWLLWYI